MHISEIRTSYSFNPNTGEYWGKKEVYVHLNEGEDPDKANELSQQATLKYLALMTPPSTPTLQVDKQEIGTDEDIFALMDKCTTAKELEQGFRLIAFTKSATTEFYTQKMKQLSKS